MLKTAAQSDIEQIIRGEHHDPFRVLGPHRVEVPNGVAIAIRAFLPEAERAWVVSGELSEPAAMEKVDPCGFFEAVFEKREQPFAYRLKLQNDEGRTWELADPYSFWPALSDFDLHLLGEGTHQAMFEKLGAHLVDLGGYAGVLFAVWAPNAERVSLIGDFNRWDGRRHPMRCRYPSGIWELFMPGLVEGEKYKFEIHCRSGYVVQKADPFAFYSERRPKTGSIIYDTGRYQWGDAEWISRRESSSPLDAPISIYEVHLGSWKRHHDPANSWLTYREVAAELVKYVKEMGFSHIELLPVSEHPFDGSWGYQTTGYFAVTSRYGEPCDFQFLVDTCHQNGIGVILDWVPAHFPMDEHGLRYFDGTYLYEHEDPRLGLHQDWGTAIFNFGRTEVRNFLISNALFWLDKFHIDGLRVDAVASMLYLDYSRQPGQWVPNRYGGNENLEAISFLKDFNTLVHGRYPGVLTIAEESTAWPRVSHPVYLGGLGFSLKWNMGWMHDMLSYFTKDPVYRKYNQDKLTFALMYAFTENFVLVLSHDEVVHMKGSMLSKMPGDDWQKFANLRALYSLMFAFPGKKLLFMGDEFGQWAEWNHDRSLDWQLLDLDSHRRLQRCVRDLNHLYRELPQLHSVDFHYSGFEWLDFADSDHSVISFVRKARHKDGGVVVVGNFTPVPRCGYRIPLPWPGEYRVIYNSDSETYGGSNMGDGSIVVAEEVSYQGRPFSLMLTLPPMAVVYLIKDTSSQI